MKMNEGSLKANWLPLALFQYGLGFFFVPHFTIEGLAISLYGLWSALTVPSPICRNLYLVEEPSGCPSSGTAGMCAPGPYLHP